MLIQCIAKTRRLTLVLNTNQAFWKVISMCSRSPSPPHQPIPGSGSKTYLNGWNRDLSLKTRFFIMKNTHRYNNFERFFFICIQNIKKTLKVLYIFWKALLKPIWKCKIYMQRYNTFLKITNPGEPIFVLFYCLYKIRYNYLNIDISILKDF